MHIMQLEQSSFRATDHDRYNYERNINKYKEQKIEKRKTNQQYVNVTSFSNWIV